MPLVAIDVRCPAGQRNLFARVAEDGLWEVACPNCRKTLNLIGGDVRYVIHRYTPQGVLVDTRTILNGDVADIP